MAIWVCRTGTSGQFENVFYENNAIYYTRDGFNYNLAITQKEVIVDDLSKKLDGAAKQTISNTWSQIDIFAHRMHVGDVVVVPKKNSRIIGVGIITSDYQFDAAKSFPFQHKRTVCFASNNIDTSEFPQDLKYSLRAYRTVFSIKEESRLLQELSKKGVVLSKG